MKALDKLKQEFEQTSKLLEAVTEKHLDLYYKMEALSKPERIVVPKNIMFEKTIGDDNLSIISPDKRCVLGWWSDHGGSPSLLNAGMEDDPLRFVYKGDLFLEPCSVEDLKQGDIVFNNIGKPNYEAHEISGYAVVLNKEQTARFVPTQRMNGYRVVVEDNSRLETIHKVVIGK